MKQNRRSFLQKTGMLAGAIGITPTLLGNAHSDESDNNSLPAEIEALQPSLDGVVPISVEERKQRIAKAQDLMQKNKIDGIFLEGTTSCNYFTGLRWGQSERTFGVVIPAKGAIAYVCPQFEEDRARELINPVFGEEVRCWEEHESPYALILGIIKDRGIRFRRIGMEERVRFFIADGVKKLASGIEIVDATPITAGFASIQPGMTQAQLSRNISAAYDKLGYSGSASVQVGKYSALPHGSIVPQKIMEGDVVMVDGGTSCLGYASDITRTIVVGKPTDKQIAVWNLEKKAQDAAFAAIRLGAPCEVVDAAARAVIENAGYGKNYKLPGLPHRTGHGIGMEGHEWTNFVKGNTTPIGVGMCFSDEPTISIPGEFGIRLEDCLYITENGPRFFSAQSISIDQPFG
jgi:Xaa-Pro dipeptidase